MAEPTAPNLNIGRGTGTPPVGGGTGDWFDQVDEATKIKITNHINYLMTIGELDEQDVGMLMMQLEEGLKQGPGQLQDNVYKSDFAWNQWKNVIDTHTGFQKFQKESVKKQLDEQEASFELHNKAAQEQAEADRRGGGRVEDFRPQAFTKGIEELYKKQPPAEQALSDEWETMYPFLAGLSPAQREYFSSNARDLMTEFRTKYPGAREQWLAAVNAPRAMTNAEAAMAAEEEVKKWETMMPEYESVFGSGKKLTTAPELGHADAMRAANEGSIPGTTYNQLLSGAPAGLADAKSRLKTYSETPDVPQPELGEDPLKEWLKKYPFADKYWSQPPQYAGARSYTYRYRPPSQVRV